MCVLSMVGDFYSDKWRPKPTTGTPANNPYQWPQPVTRQEFDQLKRDVEDMKALMIRAKEYDRANGEPDCELEEKVALLKKVAEMVGVDLSDVLGP